MDGSPTSNGLIGAGGARRDSTGCWISEFMCNIGFGEVLLAEAWGLFYVLKLASDLCVGEPSSSRQY